MKRLLKMLPVLILVAVMVGCSCMPTISFGSNQPPKAYIDSITPANAAAGSPIAFSGHGTDADGTVVAYRWRSSINGDFGTTASFDTSSLSMGTHIIYFKVQDNTGNWSDEMRDRITVTEGGAPSGPTPIITSFFAAPGTISPGGSATISWNVSNATSISIDNGIGTVAAAGSTTVSPATTTLYTITATSATGSITATTQIVVGSTSAGLPTINSFTASPAAILLGASTTLSWNVSDATAVFIDKGIGPVAPADTRNVSPAVTTTYTLTATNATGTRIQSVTVTVHKLLIPMPTPTFPIKPVKTTGALPTIESEDGAIAKDGSSYTVFAGTGAGDRASNIPRRAFLSFDISSIPVGSTITEAILDLSAYTKEGNPTYATLGFFEIYFYEYGNYSSLQTSSAVHFNTTGQLVKGGRYSSYPFSPWKLSVEETSTSVPLLQNMVGAGKNRCQFKIQFSTATDGDNTADLFYFNDATLTIKYTEP
ncbi:MAG TPA: hypothetical protein DCX22_00450 [Dehalococcoidia bacterium]|nr:hypothetical protein [Dehalococcoidia bacterium]